MVKFSVKNGVEPETVKQNDANLSPQMTLAQSVRLSGKGLHGGEDVNITIHPSDEDTGILFSDGHKFVKGVAHNVVDTARGTTIGFNGSRFRTIEHLMAALRGIGVDNAFIEVGGAETPALDGSAKPYVEALQNVGLVEQSARRKPIVLQEPVYVSYNGSFILAVPAPRLTITYVMNYDHPLIGSQSFTYNVDENTFGDEIAPARTFVLYEEVEELLNNGLSRGGSLDNVIVIWQDRMSTELRFPDELIRHKVMDLIGDLALVGGLLQAEVLAVKSGHMLNVEFAKEVLRITSKNMQNEPLLEAV